MARQSLDAFYNKVLDDAGLQAKLRGINDADRFVGTMVALGKNEGYEFSPDEVRNAIAENQAAYNRPAAGGELSDEQLEAVSGGAGGAATRAGFEVGGQAVPAINTLPVASGQTNSSTCGNVCSNACRF